MGRQPNKLKQNPKLVQNAMSDGRASLVLEYYLGRTETPVYDDDGNPVLYTTGAMKGKPKYTVKHNRKKESLNLYIWLAPRTAQERQQNKNTLQLAEKIRFEKEQEMLEDRKGYRLKREKECNFLRYFQSHTENEAFTKPVRKSYYYSYVRFTEYLGLTPRFSKYTKILPMDAVTPDMVTGFINYLRKKGSGEGPRKNYHWFKKVCANLLIDKNEIYKNANDRLCKENETLVEENNMLVSANNSLVPKVAELVEHHDELEQANAKLTDDIARLEMQKMRKMQDADLAKYKADIERYFPDVSDLLFWGRYCTSIGFPDSYVHRILNFEKIGFKGQLYSHEHQQSFRTEGSWAKLERSADNKHTFELKIDGVSVFQRFKDMARKLLEKRGFRQIMIREPSVFRAFDTFIRSMREHGEVYSREETAAIIRKYIDWLKQGGTVAGTS